jgi:ribosomal protein L11 methyltransferase
VVSGALPGIPLDLQWEPFDGEAWLEARGTTSFPMGEAGVLRILPGVAFGDGAHPTTRRCLAELGERVTPGARIADVGAGSGILGLAAALLGAAHVLAVEMDPAGCLEVEANARLNGVQDRVRTVRMKLEPGASSPLAEGPGSRNGIPGRWDGIAANVEAGVLLPLLPDLAAPLAAGGWLLTSGLLASERDAIVGAAGAQGLRLDRAHVDDGWCSLVFVR